MVRFAIVSMVALLAACATQAESDEDGDTSSASEALAACPPARAAHAYYEHNEANGVQVASITTCGSAVYLVGRIIVGSEQDIWIARRNVSDGSEVWTKRLGVAGQIDEGTAATVDASCNLYVGAATSAPSIDLGNGPLTGNAVYDPLLVKFSPAGVARWSKRLHAASPSYASAFIHGMAVDANGGLAITGEFSSTGGGTIDAGGGPIAGQGYADIFVAKYNAQNGKYIFGIDDGGPSGDVPAALVVNASGDILVTGTLQLANFSPFLAKYSGVNGARVFQKIITSYGTSSVNAMALDPTSGDVVIGGYTLGELDFGNGQTVIAPPTGAQPWLQGEAGFAAKLAGTDGTPSWVKGFSSPVGGSVAEVSGVGVGACGDVFLTGSFEDTVTFGTVPRTVPSPEISAQFTARYGSTGTPIWDAVDATETRTYPSGLALNNNNNVLLTAAKVSDSFTSRTIRYRP